MVKTHFVILSVCLSFFIVSGVVGQLIDPSPSITPQEQAAYDVRDCYLEARDWAIEASVNASNQIMAESEANRTNDNCENYREMARRGEVSVLGVRVTVPDYCETPVSISAAITTAVNEITAERDTKRQECKNTYDETMASISAVKP